MQRYKLAGCAAFVLMAMSSPGWSDDIIPAPPPTTSTRVSLQIARLSSPDPDVRADAAARLINFRDAAWPALRREAQTASPRLRNEIDHVLLHVPWIKPGDNDALVQAFTQYAEKDADDRCNVIRLFWTIPGTVQQQTPPAEALLRIILNDPCGAVRWEAANAMRIAFDNNATGNSGLATEVIELVDGTRPDPQGYVAPSLNAPLIAVAGWAVRTSKPAVCAERLDRAIAMEEEHPSAFRGQMDFALNWSIERATGYRRHERLIHLLRLQAGRTPWPVVSASDDMDDDDAPSFDELVPVPVQNFFAAQANYGPDPEFKQDLLIYREYFVHPEMVYTLSQLARHTGHPLVSEALAESAMLMNGLDGSRHFATAEFLSLHRWNQACERELRLALFLGGVSEAEVDLKLSLLADQRTDDLAAGKYLEAALAANARISVLRNGKRIPLDPVDAWAEVYMHYLRFAQQNNDVAGMKTNLEKILGQDEGQRALANAPGMASDVVPALQRLGRSELADRIFDTAFNALQDEVNANLDDPMPKNNLAWLCVCAGKKLDEAAKLAQDAVAIAPGEGAYLDTQAEIFMRMGQPAKAVQNELLALEDRPDDLYMAKQLARFKAAAAQKK